MKVSHAGILVLIALTVLSGTSCNYYNQVIARKNLVDGAKAYRDRKYDVAEALFRDAVERDPQQRTAQLFLARTLHSEFAANRTDTAKADQAIEEYKKTIEEYKGIVAGKSSALAGEQSPCSFSDDEIRRMPEEKRAAMESFKTLGASLKAVANLLDNLQKADERAQWLQQWGEDTSLQPCLRAEAYTSLAAKENTCANDITEQVKKTVEKEGKAVFVFSKPTNPEDYAALKSCTERGTELVNKALELDKNNESVWSYKTSLLIQAMRIAEMEGRTADKDKLKTEADTAKAEFTRLAAIDRQKKDEEEARRKAEAEEKEAR